MTYFPIFRGLFKKINKMCGFPEAINANLKHGILTLSLLIATLGISHGQVLTPTPIEILSPTFTPTPSPSFTPTVTISPTPTGTLSPSITPTPSSTPTPTITFTYTPTGTLSPSVTPTPTPTVTHTVTVTATRTSTATPTATSTPGIFKFLISPKPDSDGLVKFSWAANTPVEKVFLKIYTSGFRIIRIYEFNKKEKLEYLTAGPHEFSWDGKDEEGRFLPPGVYLCFIDLNVGKKRYEASSKTKIP